VNKDDSLVNRGIFVSQMQKRPNFRK